MRYNNMKKKLFIAGVLALGTLAFSSAQAQDRPWLNDVQVEAYGELYFMYDANQPKSGEVAPFLYSYNRHQEVNLNFGMVKLNYTQERVRANLALMAGTYVQANLSNEPEGLRNIYEANIGVKLASTCDLWLDVGIMPSHIGFESNIGADIMTMTRSMMAENSPYFSAQAKLSYGTPNKKWLLALHLMNGWQRIQRPEGNSTLAVGHQVTYTPNADWTFTSSSFIGSDTPDVDRKMRYFHHAYVSRQGEQFKLLFGFDAGVQQKEKNSTAYSNWYAPLIMGQYNLSDSWRIAARIEYYCDRDGVIIPVEASGGFQTWGYSFNADYEIATGVLWRMEVKTLQSKEAIFVRNEQAVSGQVMIGSSLSIHI